MGSAFAIADCVNTIRQMNIRLSELKLLVVLLWQFSSDEWTCVHTKTYINYGILVRCVISKSNHADKHKNFLSPVQSRRKPGLLLSVG